MQTASGRTYSRGPEAAAPSSIAPRDVVNGSTTVELSNVPYIHQAYDTPDWWDGDWSCNATAALMALEYYNILPKHPITVSTPSSHTSDYGWYIPDSYSFNGHTFNVGSPDPLGTTGYGGYGYITQNGWEDTKGHMAEYISDHGPTSSWPTPKPIVVAVSVSWMAAVETWKSSCRVGRAGR